jgi:hypothetical protein
MVLKSCEFCTSASFHHARESQHPLDAELVEQAGLPAGPVAAALVGELTRELWSDAAHRAA